MSDEAARTAKDADRRLFLEKAGRFAVVTPPVVALMLSVSGKARATGVASGGTTTTTTSASATPSDIRLKRDVVEVDRLDNGRSLSASGKARAAAASGGTHTTTTTTTTTTLLETITDTITTSTIEP